jgi:L-arabinokinase
MYRIQSGSTHSLADTAAFIGLLNHLPEHLPAAGLDLSPPDQSLSSPIRHRPSAIRNREGFFDPHREVIVTRAPGRLDVMGGIADYSGSLVLQLPIASATHVALQSQEEPTLHIVSLSANPLAPPRIFEMALADFSIADGGLQNSDLKENAAQSAIGNRQSAIGPPVDYAEACARFKRDPEHHWAAYVVGAFLVLMREKRTCFTHGARLLIASEVPEGKGVSSSAALEVAVMQAVTTAYEIELSPRETAFLCQKVENLVAGAPCGVMDQMTAACGQADRLLALLCQPGELQGTIKLPDELGVWGIDSGIRHSVGGADYSTVRTAAFMGYRMIADMAGLRCDETEIEGLVHIDDHRWSGYLANITPEEFEQSYAAQLPRQMSGEEFLRRYQGITDQVTKVRRDRTYPVYQATRHPIYEHARVCLFAETLKKMSRGAEEAGGQGSRGAGEPVSRFRSLPLAVLKCGSRGAGEPVSPPLPLSPSPPLPLSLALLLGELMYQSHESYSACGLGSSGTDDLVRLVREAGAAKGLYGAKITGGGSGGTVAVLGSCDAGAAIKHIAEKYAERTGYQPILISGSSPGAGVFGHLRLVETQNPRPKTEKVFGLES